MARKFLIIIILLVTAFVLYSLDLNLLNYGSSSSQIETKKFDSSVDHHDFQDELEDWKSISKTSFKGVVAKVDDDIYGVVGAISDKISGDPILLDSTRWEFGGYLTKDDVWGRKVESGTPYLTESGLGYLVNSQGRWNGKSYASIPILLHTKDFKTWESSEPVLEYSDWQLEGFENLLSRGDDLWGRISPHGLVFDEENREYVMYFQSRQELSENPVGIRSVGIATSKDMINWKHQEDVWYTVDDYVNDHPKVTEKYLDEEYPYHLYPMYELYKESFPWVVASWKHEDYYYILMAGYLKSLMRSKHAQHGFEKVEQDLSGREPYARMTYWNGKWYWPWRNSTHVGVYVADEMTGPWNDFYPLFPAHPHFKEERDRLTGLNLFKWNGKWTIVYYARPKDEYGMLLWGREK